MKGSRFLIPFLVALGVWFSLYELVIKPNRIYDSLVIEAIALQAESVLGFIGKPSKSFDTDGSGFKNYVEISGSNGVLIGSGCDGLVIIALFVIFILFFPGKWKHKSWYLPLGVLLLHCLNVIRVSVLALIVSESPEWLKFNHDYTFTIITYGFVFLLWYIWVNRFSHSSSS